MADTPALNEEQKAFRDATRRLAREQFSDGYLERAKRAEFPWEQHKQMADLGILSLLAGPAWGGPEVPDYVAAGLAVEEIAYADFNLANCTIPPLLTSAILAEHASPEVQERWLPPLVAGEALLALGLTEPETGSDAGALRSTARRDGSSWILNGEKTSITGIPHASAIIAFARTTGVGASGVSAFLVELDAPGVSYATIPDTGWVPLGRGSVALEDVRVGPEALIGGEGNGFRTVMAGFDFTRPLLALTGIGTAMAAIDDAADWVREREAFGRRLSTFEGVSFPLAEHLTRLEAARLVCYEGLRLRNEGKPHTDLAAMAKWFGPRMATNAIRDCLLLHGHYGYSTDNPMEQRLRDALAVEIGDGTAQVQKIIIARERFGSDFVPYSRTP